MKDALHKNERVKGSSDGLVNEKWPYCIMYVSQS